jgi:hypothetical protein
MKSRADIYGRPSATPMARNPFYGSMREVAQGDLIFSFMDTRIQAALAERMGVDRAYVSGLELGQRNQ